MPYTVRFTHRALADVDAAAAYRARRSATAAVRWQVELLAQVAILEQSPNRCPLADEADDLGLELRELLYGRRRSIHRILFTIEGESVIIHRVRHAAQNRLTNDDI